MQSIITFFEDNSLENFHPLTLTRPIYDLRVGILTLGEKWCRALKTNQKPSGIHRKILKPLFREPDLHENQSDICWINPRVFPETNITERVKSLKPGSALVQDDLLIAAHIPINLHHQWAENGIQLSDLRRTKFGEPLHLLDDIWQIFQFNGPEIAHDIQRLHTIKPADPGEYPNAVITGQFPVYIEKDAIIEPGAVLYPENGPIYIGRNARIMANAVVRGPSAVCDDSVVKMGAKIYEDTTIGPVCKVGGEVSNVVFHSYSNKAHDGYAGNSVFGQWCNLGADTNTSNLKNNYSTVRFRNWKTGEEVDTGQQFIGTIMGDHSKTGINAMLNTGTLCGVCCNLFSDGYPPKFIPSFSWVSGKDVVPYHFEKAVEAMERMMERRNVKLTSSYKKLMHSIFKSTL